MLVTQNDPLFSAVYKALGLQKPFAIEVMSPARKKAEVEWFRVTKVRKREKLQ
jgi:hypothetical protein